MNPADNIRAPRPSGPTATGDGNAVICIAEAYPAIPAAQRLAFGCNSAISPRPTRNFAVAFIQFWFAWRRWTSGIFIKANPADGFSPSIAGNIPAIINIDAVIGAVKIYPADRL